MSTDARASPKPVLLAVDDDEAVLRAVESDLRRRYVGEYRVVGADSGNSALGVVDALVRRGERLALVLADQRMPGTTGVEVLTRTLELAPHAKRVLLTAYADTEAAIQAINDARLDHYLLKPWHPPEERLYPVLDDLLDDWWSDAGAELGGIRVIGHRWSAGSHALRDFLARSLVPFRWIDVADDEAAALLDASGLDAERLPVVLLEDGTALVEPSDHDVARSIGLARPPQQNFYDLVIAGGGPAGLAAAVYGASEGLRTILVERAATGGQAGTSSRIENYLGFPNGLSGAELTRRATTQARRLGAEVLSAQEVVALDPRAGVRVVRLADGTELVCHAIVVATGVDYRRLEAEGVDERTGAGVYYGAAATEARALAGEHVVVVGGANSAGQAAAHLALHADRVTVVHRGASLEASMSRYLVDQLASLDNVELRLESRVERVEGDGRVERVVVACRGAGEPMYAAAVFVYIGAQPWTDWLDGVIARDAKGFVLSGPAVRALHGAERWPLGRDAFPLETNVPGVFVVGDVRAESAKRVASAVGEGSMAVQLVHRYLAGE